MWVGVVQELPLADPKLPDIGQRGCHSVDRNAATSSTRLDARERNRQGDDLIDVGQSLDRDGIVDREFSRRPAQGSTTDATPIAIPSIERADRILLARSDSLPIERKSRPSTSPP
jgi:hypothetical protein